MHHECHINIDFYDDYLPFVLFYKHFLTCQICYSDKGDILTEMRFYVPNSELESLEEEKKKEEEGKEEEKKQKEKKEGDAEGAEEDEEEEEEEESNVTPA